MMDHPTAAARARLLAVAATLKMDTLVAGFLFRTGRQVPTAAWVYNRARHQSEVWVNTTLCLSLPDGQLRALVLHELFHLVGYGQSRLQSFARPEAVNLALDIAIEKVLVAGHYRRDTNALSRALRLKHLPPGRLAPGQQAALLACAEAPRHRLTKPFREAWRYLWEVVAHLSPELAYQVVVPLLPTGDPASRKVGVTGAEWTGDDSGIAESVLIRCLPLERNGEPLPAPVIQAINQAVGCAAGSNPGAGSWLHPLALPPPVVPPPARAAVRKYYRQQVSRTVRSAVETVAGDLMTSAEYRPLLLHPTSRELVRRSIGWPSFSYENRCLVAKPLPVYVDVSGSMAGAHHARTRAVLAALGGLLPAELKLFNVTVTALPTREVLAGELAVGGGTSFTAVFKDAFERRYRDILLITDGGSSVPEPVLLRCRQAGLRARAILFGENDDAVGADWWYRVFVWPD